MKVFAKDIHFRCAVGAAAEIAALCPNGDIKRLGEVFEGNYEHKIETLGKFCMILNAWYIKFEQSEGRTADALTNDDIMLMTTEEFEALTSEALAVYKHDASPTVKAKPKNAKAGA